MLIRDVFEIFNASNKKEIGHEKTYHRRSFFIESFWL